MKDFEVEVYNWQRWIINFSWLIIIICAISIFFFRTYVLLTSQIMVIDGFVVMGIVIEIRYREFKQKKSFDAKYEDKNLSHE